MTEAEKRPCWTWIACVALVSSHVLIAIALLGLGVLVIDTQRSLLDRKMDHIQMEAKVDALTRQVTYARRDVKAMKKALKVNGEGQPE